MSIFPQIELGMQTYRKVISKMEIMTSEEFQTKKYEMISRAKDGELIGILDADGKASVLGKYAETEEEWFEMQTHSDL